ATRLLVISSLPSPFSSQPPAASSIYSLSLHDALPIFGAYSTAFLASSGFAPLAAVCLGVIIGVALGLLFMAPGIRVSGWYLAFRSEEHTSELQSRENIVCRLLLEKKKTLCRTSQLCLT